MTRLVFAGGVEFSARCLEALLEDGVRFEAILAQAEPGANADYRDLGPVADRFGLEVRRFKRISEEEGFLRSLEPDVALLMGLSQLVPSSLLRVPRVGWLGSHPALLPRNRGRHPIVWTLANGLAEGGLSLFWLDEGVDTGDLWAQESFPISPEDDARSVYEKACAAAVRLLRAGLPDLLAGKVRRVPQERGAGNAWRKRGLRDGEIDWRMSTRRINDLVRALRPPYPGAHAVVGGSERKVWRTEPAQAAGLENLEPGKVIARDGKRITVKTGDGAIVLVEHELDGVPEPGGYLQ